MIKRDPTCIRLNDGSIVEHGDIVKIDGGKKTYTFLGLVVNKPDYDYDILEMVVALASRKSYWLADQKLEESLLVSLSDFVSTYMLLNKWSCKEHQCIEEAVYDKICKLADENRNKIKDIINE